MQENILFLHILNIYDVLLLTTCVLALFLALPLLLKRENKKHDVLLALFILSQGFYAFYSVLIFNDFIGTYIRELLYPFYKLPHFFVSGIQGILVLWYTQAMMGRPVALRSLTTSIVASFIGITMLINLYLNIVVKDDIHILLTFKWMLDAGSIVLGITALRQLNKYEIQLPFIHSSTDKHSLTWLRLIIGGFVLVWFISMSANFSVVFGSQVFTELLYLSRHIPPLLLISMMVLYSQTHAISHSTNLEVDNHKNITEVTSPVSPQSISQLDDLMERVKVYQDPELRLDGLADSMGISPRSLSSILNQHYQKNFYDFVNHYQIKDAKAQVSSKEYEQKTIQSVFEEAGFNSKTTLKILFKKHTGLTPSKFRQSTMQ